MPLYDIHPVSSLSHLCLFYLSDAHFTIRVPGSDAEQSQVYLCVADGVGSWRQYGVDPREFSHRLVENAQKVVEADAANR